MNEGMHYLHNNKIVHRDLKSANVLVKLVSAAEGEFGVDYVHARVADFGLSKIKEMSRTFSTQTLNIGTTRWMAPELYTASQYDHMNTSTSDVKLRYPFKVDIYSFGMLCYEILTGRRPFYNITLTDLRKRVLESLRPELPEECPSILATMIKRCWEPDPSARPSFSEICEVLRYHKALLILGANLHYGGEVHRS
jgi:serine/threonine protein kinase